MLTRMPSVLWRLRIWHDIKGQDLIEYALMAGFVAVVAGATVPSIATSIGQIFSKVGSTLTVRAGSS